MMLDPVFGYLISLCAALLFASASIQKIRDLAKFTEILEAHRVLPDGVALRLAALVPLSEAALAIGLLLPQSRRVAGIAAAAMLVGYATSLSLNLQRGRLDLDCGCGPAHERRPIAAWMVWRNLALAGALTIAALPWQLRALNAMDLVTLAGGISVCTALYCVLDHLLGVVVPRGLLLRSTS